jgi:hypothetical protein
MPSADGNRPAIPGTPRACELGLRSRRGYSHRETTSSRRANDTIRRWTSGRIRERPPLHSAFYEPDERAHWDRYMSLQWRAAVEIGDEAVIERHMSERASYLRRTSRAWLGDLH